MSLESEIEEDILGETEDDAYTKAEEHEKLENALGKLLENQTEAEHHLNNIEGGSASDAESRNNVETIASRCGNRKIITNEIDAKTIAIINYSTCLADNVLKEALFITDIYNRDSLNMSDAVNEEAVERDKAIRKQLFHDENGRISGADAKGGYDSYLLDKLLSSTPDPTELRGTEGFDGNEDHFKIDKDEMYPGLDREDEYVMGEMERERISSDQNNNKSFIGGSANPFEDNTLQTIHEDKELVIEGSDDENQEIADVKNFNLPEPDSLQAEDDNKDEKEHDLLPGEAITEAISENNDSGNVEDLQEAVDRESVDDSREEPDCCEMTFKEKKAMVHAVRRGDINLLERLLEKKNADMNMLWYGDTLLMVAIRAGQNDMAEFLVDNGVDWNHNKKLVEMDGKGSVSVHRMTAREMAYDLYMEDLVELLDQKMDNLFPFIKPRPRTPRLRQPIVPFEPPPLDEGMRAEFFVSPERAKELEKEARKEHFEKLRQAALEAEKLEIERINAQRRKRGLLSADDESVQMSKDINFLNEDISQVFGPDEGYETMSPESHHPRYDKYHVHNFNEPVSIRGTRAFHLKKAFNASKAGQLKRIGSPDYPMYDNSCIESVGSYNFESRQWHHPRSAPTYRNFFVESVPDTDVHVGLPFVHGNQTKSASARSCGRPPHASLSQRRTQSAHSNISPFSQVARLLEQSRLFSPVSRSSSSSTHLPAISSKRSTDWALTKTRMNYIYANRSSAKSSREDVIKLRNELLPKRKVFVK